MAGGNTQHTALLEPVVGLGFSGCLFMCLEPTKTDAHVSRFLCFMPEQLLLQVGGFSLETIFCNDCATKANSNNRVKI